jgi:glycosyltransferase involved in cell wall biosynthesis
VTPGKGQDVLVRALARLREAAWTCICAGNVGRDPAYASDVRRSAREAGLADRIEFTGECDARTIEALYQASSIFVLPSRYEAYGMALGEAMAHGLPVVSTVAGAIPETVPPGAGLLVPAGDATALADALRPLLVDAPDDPGGAAATRQRLGGAARRVAAARPDWDEAGLAFADAVWELGHRVDERAGSRTSRTSRGSRATLER